MPEDMPEATAEAALTKFYSGQELTEEDEAALRTKATSRMKAYLAKSYDKIHMGRQAPPGILFKSGAANLLAPLFNTSWSPSVCEDD